MPCLKKASCPYCECKTDYDTKLTAKDYLFSQEEFSVVKCKQCNFLYTNPRVLEDDIVQYYFPEYGPYKEAGHLRALVEKLRSLLHHRPSVHFKEILDLLKINQAHKVLEIGPGSGGLLLFLKQQGFDVTGLEMDSVCVKRLRSKGISCYRGNMNDVLDLIRAQKFDAVILCHVFEHLYHPITALKNIYEILNDNGIFYMTLPNIGSLEAKLFGKYWRGLDLPRHIVHYDFRSIEKIVTKSHFHVLQVGNSFFPSSFIESLGFILFRRRMPMALYYLLYYPWKLLGPIHYQLFGSGAMKVIAQKRCRKSSYE